MAAEARKRLIVAVKLNRGPAESAIELVVADKGYDEESNHEYAQDVLDARAATPVRTSSRSKIKLRRRRQRGLIRDFDKKEYDDHQPKEEVVFSVEKWKMGSHLLARVPGILTKIEKDGIASCSSSRVSVNHLK